MQNIFNTNYGHLKIHQDPIFGQNNDISINCEQKMSQ